MATLTASVTAKFKNFKNMQIKFNPAPLRIQNLLKMWQGINGLIDQRTPKGLKVFC